MTIRIGFEIVGAPAKILLPPALDDRPVRVGTVGDVPAALPADVLVQRHGGRVMVASASAEAPVTLAGAPLPPWFVPLALPCTLVAGNVAFRLFEAVVRPRAVARSSAPTLPAFDPPAPIEEPDTIPLDPMQRMHVVTTRSRARRRGADIAHAVHVLRDGAHAFVSEWRAASRETKIALATMLVASVLTWMIMLSLAR
jgi:hypothetical protein